MAIIVGDFPRFGIKPIVQGEYIGELIKFQRHRKASFFVGPPDEKDVDIVVSRPPIVGECVISLFLEVLLDFLEQVLFLLSIDFFGGWRRNKFRKWLLNLDEVHRFSHVEW